MTESELASKSVKYWHSYDSILCYIFILSWNNKTTLLNRKTYNGNLIIANKSVKYWRNNEQFSIWRKNKYFFPSDGRISNYSVWQSVWIKYLHLFKNFCKYYANTFLFWYHYSPLNIDMKIESASDSSN